MNAFHHLFVVCYLLSSAAKPIILDPLLLDLETLETEFERVFKYYYIISSN